MYIKQNLLIICTISCLFEIVFVAVITDDRYILCKGHKSCNWLFWLWSDTYYYVWIVIISSYVKDSFNLYFEVTCCKFFNIPFFCPKMKVLISNFSGWQTIIHDCFNEYHTTWITRRSSF